MNLKNYKPSLIFDIDGTLWDATKTSLEGFNKALRDVGSSKIISEKMLRQVTGAPWDDIAESLFSSELFLDRNLYSRLDAEEKKSIEIHGGIFYPKVQETLQSLYVKKYDIFLVSNCQDWYLNAFIRHLNLGEVILDQTCYGIMRAPKEAMIRHIIQKHALKNKVIYVGDTEGDYKAAQKANCLFIQARYGFGELLNTNGIDSFSEIESELFKAEAAF